MKEGASYPTKSEPSFFIMTNTIPCFRCSAEDSKPEYLQENEDKKCVSCLGTGVVVPGSVSEADFDMIKRFVHCCWWARLRQMKQKGMKLGKKKERDKLIKKQAKELLSDFKRMSKREQRENRLSMSAFNQQFVMNTEWNKPASENK